MCCWTCSGKNSVDFFCPSKDESQDSSGYSSSKCGTWQAIHLKVILMHFLAIRCRRRLYSIFQGTKTCLKESAKYSSCVPFSSYLCTVVTLSAFSPIYWEDKDRDSCSLGVMSSLQNVWMWLHFSIITAFGSITADRMLLSSRWLLYFF